MEKFALGGIIDQSDNKPEYSVRVLTRNSEGRLSFDRMTVLGTFESVERAVQSLEENLGRELPDWQPNRAVELRTGNRGVLHPSGKEQVLP